MPDLLVEHNGPVLRVLFNRPEARNAMTWEMYEGLVSACEEANSNPDVKVVVMAGVGEKSFIAGTDIGQFRDFGGSDGVDYEVRVDTILSAVEAVDVPVVASINGHCVGGGLAIAACADIRIASPSAKFSVPIAKTLGNTLSAASLARLVRVFGEPRVKKMLLLARSISATEALEAGFVVEVTEDLEKAVTQIVESIIDSAPVTLWSVKENLRRLVATTPDDSDVVQKVYGSADFHNAVGAFLAKRQHGWEGR